MAYNEFAYFYDEFNGEADYDALYEQIRQELNAHDIRDGILADLGCGTGELTLMLTQAGYDMIGIDQSEEMLCVVRDKAEQLGLSGKLLLLQQDLLKLDLYGTIRGAVSTFDTFNHIPDLTSTRRCWGRMFSPLRKRTLPASGATTITLRTAGWRSRWTSTTARPANTSMNSSMNIPMTWIPSEPHWKSTALCWKRSATVRASAP